MNFLKNFWFDVKHSFYGPDIYASRLKESFWKGVYFILKFGLIMSIVLSISFLLALRPVYKELLTGNFVEKYYPNEDLQIDIKDGKVSTNVEEPYIVKAPNDLNKNQRDLDKKENLFVIDTSDNLVLEKINSYNSYLVLTKDSLIINQSSVRSQTMSLSFIKDLTINENNLMDWSTKLAGVIKIASIPLMILLVLFSTLGYVLSYLFVSIFAALIVMLVGKIFKRNLSYKESYKISLFAFGPLLVINTIALIFTVANIPSFVSFLIF
jgi:hypothetical protein